MYMFVEQKDQTVPERPLYIHHHDTIYTLEQ